MTRPRLLDLFCGEGGAAMGYHRAGFDVTGVDIIDQPNYPFTFVKADAMEYPLEGFDAIHASPPCHAHTNVSNRWRGRESAADKHPDLVAATRERLMASGVPWVMENVVGAPMPNRVILHGGMFGLGTHRPRQFESSVLVMVPFAAPVRGGVAVYGDAPDGGRVTALKHKHVQFRASSIKEASEAMGGMEWASFRGMALAIPPAYTEHIGRQLLAAIETDRAA